MIKKFQKYHFSSTFIAILVIVMCSLTTLLVLEYQSLRQQVKSVLALKEEYRNYILAVKKVLSDDELHTETVIDCDPRAEKKKDVAERQFPDGVQIFSSEDDLEQECDSFVVINRDLEYLKQATYEYMCDNNMRALTNKLDPHLWQEYTDLVLEQKRAQQAKSSKRSRKKVARAPIKRRPAKRRIKKDIHFSWPIKRSNFWLSSFFGPRKNPNGSKGFHYGIDMAAMRGTSVKAAAAGVVIEAGYVRGYGNTVVIAHNNKYKTRYAHLDKILTKVGQKVHRGLVIGKVGDTGFVRKSGKDASHLHFEVYAFGKKVNPMYFLG